MDDVFRCVENGTGPHPDNILWLDAVLEPAIRQLGGTRTRVTGHEFAQRRLDVGKFMKDAGQTFGVGSWAHYHESDETSRLRDWLLSHLQDIDIVVGFELPNAVFDALCDTDLTVVDVTFSPIRFLSDLCLDVRCNNEELKQHLAAIVIPDEEVIAEVAQITGTIRRRFNGVRTARSLGKTGVLLGQTAIDASLIDCGRIVQLKDYAGQIVEWAKAFDTVILKPHPYRKKSVPLPYLRQCGARIVTTTTNPYQLFSYENVEDAAGISSSSLTEASWFGVTPLQFLTPPRDRNRVSPTKRVSSAFFSVSFWQAWTEAQQPNPNARRLPSLRAQISTDWGYGKSYSDPIFRRVRGVPRL